MHTHCSIWAMGPHLSRPLAGGTRHPPPPPPPRQVRIFLIYCIIFRGFHCSSISTRLYTDHSRDMSEGIPVTDDRVIGEGGGGTARIFQVGCETAAL